MFRISLSFRVAESVGNLGSNQDSYRPPTHFLLLLERRDWLVGIFSWILYHRNLSWWRLGPLRLLSAIRSCCSNPSSIFWTSILCLTRTLSRDLSCECSKGKVGYLHPFLSISVRTLRWTISFDPFPETSIVRWLPHSMMTLNLFCSFHRKSYRW